MKIFDTELYGTRPRRNYEGLDQHENGSYIVSVGVLALMQNTALDTHLYYPAVKNKLLFDIAIHGYIPAIPSNTKA